MTKQFAVPPVIFPSGGGVNPTMGNINQLRVPTAPFQPSRLPSSSSSAIPFMSFDIGPAASSSGSFGGSIFTSAASGSASFDYEEPLLDELGIHPDQIWHKTKSILNPFRINPTAHKDSNLSGPIFLYLSLCLFQLLAGKIQFGVILGWIVVCSIFLYIVFNMLAGRNGNLDLHTCTSVIGYCMLPVVILSAASLFIPQESSVPRYVMAGVFVVWATRACTNLMVALADGGEEHLGLIAAFYLLPSPPLHYTEATTYLFKHSRENFPQNNLKAMASAIKEISEHGGTSNNTQNLTEMEEEEELFEINLEAVDCIPPPHYWEAFFTATSNALLANCLLPISDLSSAIPTVSTACSTLSREGLTNMVMVAESLPGKSFGIQFMKVLGYNTRK